MINPMLYSVVRWWLWLSIVGCTDHQSIVVVARPFLVLIVGSVEDRFNFVVGCIDNQSNVVASWPLLVFAIVTSSGRLSRNPTREINQKFIKPQ
jgi:hypothetical protein